EHDELARVGRIHKLAAAFDLDDVWAQRHVRAGTAADEVLLDATAERAKRATPIDGHIDITADYDGPGARLDQMAEGLSARARGVAPAAGGQRYYRATFVECAFDMLKPRGLVRTLDARRNGGRIIELALHTQSDFPLLLSNALNKSMLPAYQNANPTYRLLA